MRVKTLHEDSDGISPYLMCPWCGYCDVIGEFSTYKHFDEICNGIGTGSTQCGQCLAAGNTGLFLLAANKEANLYDCEESRVRWLGELTSCPEGVD